MQAHLHYKCERTYATNAIVFLNMEWSAQSNGIRYSQRTKMEHRSTVIRDSGAFMHQSDSNVFVERRNPTIGGERMKLVKIVKLQRVRLGSLDGGDMCTPDLDRGWRATAHKALRNGCGADDIVLALDKKKYPPEVTYNIEGMTAEGEDPDVYVDSLGGVVLLGLFHFDESEIETRYI